LPLRGKQVKKTRCAKQGNASGYHGGSGGGLVWNRININCFNNTDRSESKRSIAVGSKKTGRRSSRTQAANERALSGVSRGLPLWGE